MVKNNFASKFTDLKARSLSVLIAAPLVVLAVYVGGLFYDAVVLAAILLGMYEWLRLHERAPSLLCEGTNFLGLILVWWLASVGNYALACLLLTAIGGFAYNLYERAKLDNPAWLAFGLPYLGAPLIALVALGNQEDSQKTFIIFYLLLTVWATDIGAYAFGRIIGGPKLAPIISPSKTYAGLFGAVLCAVLVGVAYHYFMQQQGAALIWLAGLVAVAAQLGDLFESYVKRRAGVKDSGRLLPGHGGILDRIDGLLVAAVLVALWHFAVI